MAARPRGPGPPKKSLAEHNAIQAEFLDEKLMPVLTAAQSGQGHVFFVDAAHFMFETFVCCLWSFTRLFVRAASGRQRFNVLGAWNAVTRELVSVTNTTVVNTETMCELLRRISERPQKQQTRRPIALREIRFRSPGGLPDDVVNEIDSSRWGIELFFRWLKSILGMRHLISDHRHGVTMQLYAALIPSLLIVLWTGLKANKRTWEMLQFYFMGWATLTELERHLQQQKERQKRQATKTGN